MRNKISLHGENFTIIHNFESTLKFNLPMFTYTLEIEDLIFVCFPINQEAFVYYDSGWRNNLYHDLKRGREGSFVISRSEKVQTPSDVILNDHISLIYVVMGKIYCHYSDIDSLSDQICKNLVYNFQIKVEILNANLIKYSIH